MRAVLLSFLLCLLSGVSALHFNIPATDQPEPICIRDFVTQGQLVVISVTSDGRVGDGQNLSLEVSDSMGSQYRSKKDFAGDVKVAFNAPATTSFDVCLTNVIKTRGRDMSRNIEVDIESGSEARDWNRIQTTEKLKPIEVELRRIEELTDEIVEKLNYMKDREERLRDTNESTNRRVRNFSLAVVFVFIALGGWQINYLKTYFRAKHII